ncbi:Uncharacterised protein [Raoultella terrigena]|nr:Uncharacterised protein [Raoultella terrigena]
MYVRYPTIHVFLLTTLEAFMNKDEVISYFGGVSNLARLFPVDEVGLFLVTFTLPFKPAISKTNRTSMLPEGLKHSACCRSFYASIYKSRFIPPPGRVSPVDRIEMQFFIALAQQ